MLRFTGHDSCNAPDILLPFPLVIASPLKGDRGPRAIVQQIINAAVNVYRDANETARERARRAIVEAITGNFVDPECIGRSAACAAGEDCGFAEDGLCEACNSRSRDASQGRRYRRPSATMATAPQRWPQVQWGYTLIPFPIVVQRPENPKSLIESARAAFPGNHHAQSWNTLAAILAWHGDARRSKTYGDAARCAGGHVCHAQDCPNCGTHVAPVLTPDAAHWIGTALFALRAHGNTGVATAAMLRAQTPAWVRELGECSAARLACVA